MLVSMGDPAKTLDMNLAGQGRLSCLSQRSSGGAKIATQDTRGIPRENHQVLVRAPPNSRDATGRLLVSFGCMVFIEPWRGLRSRGMAR